MRQSTPYVLTRRKTAYDKYEHQNVSRSSAGLGVEALESRRVSAMKCCDASYTSVLDLASIDESGLLVVSSASARLGKVAIGASSGGPSLLRSAAAATLTLSLLVAPSLVMVEPYMLLVPVASSGGGDLTRIFPARFVVSDKGHSLRIM